MEPDVPADAPGVPLSEMIETLRQELQRSIDRGQGQAVAFEIEQVELELKVAVSRKAKGEGGVAFWVVKAGAAVEGQRDLGHTFKLTLRPVGRAPGATRLTINDAAAERPQRN